MSQRSPKRRRPAVQISLARAARLHRLVGCLAATPQTREQILAALNLGLRTFYRELELLKRVGVTVKLQARRYTLATRADEAAGRLPFPDPQLTFAEMAELATSPTPAGQRLAALLAQVTTMDPRPTRKGRGDRA